MDTLVSPTCVKDRLKACVQYWRKAPGLVVKTIASGSVFPLMPGSAHRNQASVLLAREFVQQSVTELILGGCIHKVPLQPHMYPPLDSVQ